MTHFDAYLLTRLDSFNCLFNIVFALSTLASIIVVALWLSLYEADEEPESKTLKKCLKISLFSLALSGIACCVIPTTKEAAFIYIAPAIVNNKEVQQTIKQIPELSALGLEYLKETLKEEIKEKTQ